MTLKSFEDWLNHYGEAWIQGNPTMAISLFSKNAAYYEDPFQSPMVGLDAIQKYWTEGAQEGQRDITFNFQIITVNNDTAYAHWQATFHRIPTNTWVELDGILCAKFNQSTKCTEFREWWQRKES